MKIDNHASNSNLKIAPYKTGDITNKTSRTDLIPNDNWANLTRAVQKAA